MTIPWGDAGGVNVDHTLRVFEHINCKFTRAERPAETLTEKVQASCGSGAVRLSYTYDHPEFYSTEPGQIRLVLPTGRYLKHYDGTGTFAFRMDSMFSHMSIMRGALTGDKRYGFYVAYTGSRFMFCISE